MQILLETIQKTNLFWTISEKFFNGLKIPALYVPRRITWAKNEIKNKNIVTFKDRNLRDKTKSLAEGFETFTKTILLWILSSTFWQMFSYLSSMYPKRIFEAFSFLKSFKKLQFLSDIEQNVCLLFSYQPPTCQEKHFQQTSMKNSETL